MGVGAEDGLRRVQIGIIIACVCYSATSCGRKTSSETGSAPAQTGGVAGTPSAAAQGANLPAGGLRRVPACDLVSRAEMAELLGGAIGKPSGETSEAKTTCTWPPADPGSRAQAEVTIEWEHGTGASFQSQLSGAFSGSAVGRQVAHAVPFGDEAAYSLEGVLTVRTGRTLVTISLPMRPEAEERSMAVARKLFERIGADPTPAANTTHPPPPAAGASPETPGTPPKAPGEIVETPVFPEGLSPAEDCPAVAPLPPPATPPLVPLKAGLTLAHVWKPYSESGKEEYECLLQVTAVTDTYADVTYTCEGLSTIGHRRVCTADMRDSHFYITEAGMDEPVTLRGALMFSLSSHSLEELKATHDTAHRYVEIVTDWRKRKQPLLKDFASTLHSTRFDRETYSIIVNDRTVDLPVLTGLTFPSNRWLTTVKVLDSPPLPLMLEYSVLSVQFSIHYTKISFPTDGEIERHLAVDKHIDVYGIYFDFGSDRLRPESGPVIAEIAGVLTKNPDWSLAINGHTDNIGGDAFNLALSRRRSEAVRKVLVDQYHIAPARLATAGFGASQPKADNDTPDGRAKNRRVELIRQ